MATKAKAAPKKKAALTPVPQTQEADSAAQTWAVKRLSVRYITDRRGRRVAVILPLKEFEELVEAAEQRDDWIYLQEAEAEEGDPIPLEALEARLRAQGKLP